MKDTSRVHVTHRFGDLEGDQKVSDGRPLWSLFGREEIVKRGAKVLRDDGEERIPCETQEIDDEGRVEDR